MFAPLYFFWTGFSGASTPAPAVAGGGTIGGVSGRHHDYSHTTRSESLHSEMGRQDDLDIQDILTMIAKIWDH